ncbi:hypothetical protein Ahy_B03g066994 [Arachis hypogaea]|uniref:UspA domain-containing protein n=1 Tax=Arachis hypogaea TaxID=3818 RepID=A0A445A5P6_ARAHY|nr:hypothetical protein Ahy_B03g066994 [Arachis hypogaea]
MNVTNPQPPVPSSPVLSPLADSQRKIAIAVDLSDESAYAVKWAVQNYLRPGDAVILLHVRPTSVLYGADWGSDAGATAEPGEESRRKLEEDFVSFTSSKVSDLSQPLVEAEIPFRYPHDKNSNAAQDETDEVAELLPVPEEEEEYHDASDQHKVK